VSNGLLLIGSLYSLVLYLSRKRGSSGNFGEYGTGKKLSVLSCMYNSAWATVRRPEVNRRPCFGKGDIPGSFLLGVPPCLYCKHLLKAGDLEGTGWTRKAFPDGINYLILMREEDHTNPLPYDNGYRFQVDLFVAEDEKVCRMDW
jgi:hypothetical protein